MVPLWCPYVHYRGKYRPYNGNQHYAKYGHWRLFPVVPSDFTGITAGNRHYSTGATEGTLDYCTSIQYQIQKYIIKIKMHSSCEIEDFVETHLCKLCVILRSRVLLGVCPH